MIIESLYFLFYQRQNLRANQDICRTMIQSHSGLDQSKVTSTESIQEHDNKIIEINIATCKNPDMEFRWL
jgi:hypothetical protein